MCKEYIKKPTPAPADALCLQKHLQQEQMPVHIRPIVRDPHLVRWEKERRQKLFKESRKHLSEMAQEATEWFYQEQMPREARIKQQHDERLKRYERRMKAKAGVHAAADDEAGEDLGTYMTNKNMQRFGPPAAEPDGGEAAPGAKRKSKQITITKGFSDIFKSFARGEIKDDLSHRNRTTFGIVHDNNNQGPHAISVLQLREMEHAMEKNEFSPHSLIGTRMLPTPKAAETILKNFLVEDGSPLDDFAKPLHRYVKLYNKHFDKMKKSNDLSVQIKEYGKLKDLSPIQSYVFRREATEEELANKPGGGRRQVAENLLNGLRTHNDFLGATATFITKGEKEEAQHEKISKTQNGDIVDLSPNTEESS